MEIRQNLQAEASGAPRSSSCAEPSGATE